MELLEDDVVEYSTEDSESIKELMTLSLNTILGLPSHIKTKLKGTIDKWSIVIMLDTGSTHNIITPSLVKKTRLKTSKEKGLENLLGTRITVKSLGIWEVLM